MNTADLDSQLCIALLDEANLSPIEHYWSGFMGAYDNREGFSTQGANLTLPEGLRFVSTVNYDRTTEALSARFLDRSPVISLDSDSAVSMKRTVGTAEVEEVYLNYSYKQLNKLFGKQAKAKFTSDEQRLFEELYEDFSFLPIKHRKYNSIVQFTNTLRDFFDDEKDSLLKSFDLSILVNVLPLISGQGAKYKEQCDW